MSGVHWITFGLFKSAVITNGVEPRATVPVVYWGFPTPDKRIRAINPFGLAVDVFVSFIV
jgi:hypothetical protein